MCDPHQHIEAEILQKKKYRLADFFNMWWDEYCKQPTEYIETWQYKAVNAIRVCRTEVLGVDYYACPDCGEMSAVYHSCKHRFCPSCSWTDTIKWSENIKSRMLNIAHRHVVFTLPHSLNGLLKQNQRQLLNMLSRAAANTFKDWMRNKYGILCGIIAVIHTFGEKKNLHPHIHMILSWGGLDIETGELIELTGKDKKYVKYDFLKKKFRIKFEDQLIAAFDNEELSHKFDDRMEFMQFIKSINKNSWQIHLEPPMDCPADVIRYIGRYSKRACLSEYKITNIEGEYISFSYKEYKERDENGKPIENELRLHYRKFFPLLLQHVPLPYFRLVRYYGIYARFDQIPQQYRATEETKLSESIEVEYKTDDKNPKYCSACTCAKVYVYTLIDIRPKPERNEPFDIKRHKHLIYKKQLFDTEKGVKKKAA